MKINSFFVSIVSCCCILASARDDVTSTESDQSANNLRLDSGNVDTQSVLIGLLLESGRGIGTIHDQKENEANNSSSDIQPSTSVVANSTNETPSEIEDSTHTYNESQIENSNSGQSQISGGDFVADEDLESIIRQLLTDTATEKSYNTGDYVSNDEEFNKILEGLRDEASGQEVRKEENLIDSTEEVSHGTVTEYIEICPICLEDINEKNNFRTPCGHRMHLDCYQIYRLHGGMAKVSKSYINRLNYFRF